MWWECRDCVAGGNSDKSHQAHGKANPDHRVEVFEDWKEIRENDD